MTNLQKKLEKIPLNYELNTNKINKLVLKCIKSKEDLPKTENENIWVRVVVLTKYDGIRVCSYNSFYKFKSCHSGVSPLHEDILAWCYVSDIEVVLS